MAPPGAPAPPHRFRIRGRRRCGLCVRRGCLLRSVPDGGHESPPAGRRENERRTVAAVLAVTDRDRAGGQFADLDALAMSTPGTFPPADTGRIDRVHLRTFRSNRACLLGWHFNKGAHLRIHVRPAISPFCGIDSHKRSYLTSPGGQCAELSYRTSGSACRESAVRRRRNGTPVSNKPAQSVHTAPALTITIWHAVPEAWPAETAYIHCCLARAITLRDRPGESASSVRRSNAS